MKIKNFLLTFYSAVESHFFVRVDKQPTEREGTAERFSCFKNRTHKPQVEGGAIKENK